MAFNDEKKDLTNSSEMETEVVVEEETTQEPTEEIVVEESNQKEKSKKTKNKKTSWIKAAFSELKKVTYPSFGSVVKKTIVVLCVTLFFLVIIFGFDTLLNFLKDLLIKD